MSSNYQLVIFDKDGTLIDFHSMWGGWVVELARRLAFTGGAPVAEALYEALGFDPASGRVRPEGKLVTTPMTQLYDLTVEVVSAAGLSPEAAEAAVAVAWHVPDPVTLARPCANLEAVFGALHEHGIKIAVATTDDRAPTVATLAALGLTSFVDVLVCADDGVPVKPAPHMIWEVCRATGIDPAQTIIVGDALADLQMGRAAGVGLVVGVLTGASSAELLEPLADKVLESVEDLVTLLGWET